MATDALPTDPPSDDVTVRCPRLGHQIHFAYCRSENMGLPCFKTLDCWHLLFDVTGHMKLTLSRADFKASFEARATPKVQTLMDLIQQAQSRQAGRQPDQPAPGDET